MASELQAIMASNCNRPMRSDLNQRFVITIAGDLRASSCLFHSSDMDR